MCGTSLSRRGCAKLAHVRRGSKDSRNLLRRNMHFSVFSPILCPCHPWMVAVVADSAVGIPHRFGKYVQRLDVVRVIRGRTHWWWRIDVSLEVSGTCLFFAIYFWRREISQLLRCLLYYEISLILLRYFLEDENSRIFLTNFLPAFIDWLRHVIFGGLSYMMSGKKREGSLKISQNCGPSVNKS